METIVNYMPLVSIILPTYNRAKMLERAIASIIAQHYTNWELIIVDNYSVDKTEEVIAQFNDGRIKVLKIQNDGSIGKSRNYGIHNASGEWVAFIDSDDWWLPNKLTVCIDACSDNVDLIYHDLLIAVDGKIKKWKKAKGRLLKSPVINDLISKNNAIANSSVMVRRTILESVGHISEDMNINPSVDYNTWLKVANFTDAFKYIPKALGVYLIHGGGVSQRDMSISYEYAILEFIDLLSNDELTNVHRNINYMHGRYEYINKKDTLAECALKKCLHYHNLKIAVKAVFMLSVIRLRSLTKS